MKINKDIFKFVEVSIVNSLILCICYLGSLSEITKPIVYLVVLSIYFLYLLIQNEKVIVIYQISMLLISVFIFDIMFHYIRIDTPLELQFVPEVISIILLLRILINKEYKNVLLDPFIVISLGIIFISLFIVIINKASIIDYLNAIRIYFRFLPIYIVFSKNEFKFKQIYKVLYICNLLVFILLSYMGTHQDLRNGIFGITGGSVFQVFVMIWVLNVLVRYLNKEASILKLSFVLIVTIIMFAVAESKAYIIIMIAITFTITLVIRTKLLKKIFIGIVFVMVFMIGVELLVTMYPNFAYFVKSDNVVESIEEYLFGNSNRALFTKGRFEAMEYIIDLEHIDGTEKLLGIGLGSSLPPEYLFYENDKKNNQEVIETKESRIFDKYGARIGYHLSSFSAICIDAGLIGVIISIIILFIFLYRGYFVLKNGTNSYIKTIGAIGIYIPLAAIYSCGYSNALFVKGYMMLVMILLGMLEYYYRDYKERG